MHSMSDKISLPSYSSVPPLQRADDDDDSVEILIFDEDIPEMEDECQYGVGLDDELPHGYTIAELAEYVTFVKSSKDARTGDFELQRKTLLWCVEHGCEEVRPGLWAGLWYFQYLFGEQEGKRSWVETMSRRLVKESGGRAIQLRPEDFSDVMHEKRKGNRAFQRGQYKTALDCYQKAESLMGGDISGFYLVPHQREEMVNLLSNQAECFLRQRKYHKAILKATKALQLDKRHNKSLFRRARAIMNATNQQNSSRFNTLVMPSTAADDLRAIVQMNGAGASEAAELLDKFNLQFGAQAVY